MHILSAGDGYAYYTSEVATGDAKRDRDRDLGDYYTVDGNPPGRWMGRGADVLGVSGTVTEDQMKALYGEGLHPDAPPNPAATNIACQVRRRTRESLNPAPPTLVSDEAPCAAKSLQWTARDFEEPPTSEI